MSIKKIVLLVGLSVLFAGCSTGGYNGMANMGPATTSDMGMRYLLGRGVAQNNAKAFSYFKQAADNENDPFAQNELGYMYAAGKGTSRDYGQAIYYYTKAANHGLASAQYNLGLLYMHGMGTPRNKEEGLKWIRKAAAHGFEPAKHALEKYGA